MYENDAFCRSNHIAENSAVFNFTLDENDRAQITEAVSGLVRRKL